MSNAKTGLNVQIKLTLKDVQKILCPKCKGKLRQLVTEHVRDRMTDKLVEQVLD